MPYEHDEGSSPASRPVRFEIRTVYGQKYEGPTESRSVSPCFRGCGGPLWTDGKQQPRLYVRNHRVALADVQSPVSIDRLSFLLASPTLSDNLPQACMRRCFRTAEHRPFPLHLSVRTNVERKAA